MHLNISRVTACITGLAGKDGEQKEKTICYLLSREEQLSLSKTIAETVLPKAKEVKEKYELKSADDRHEIHRVTIEFDANLE